MSKSKILEEIRRFNEITKIMLNEQDPLAGAPPAPEAGAETPPAPEAGAPPAPPAPEVGGVEGTETEEVDVENDPDVEVIDEPGKDKEEGGEEEGGEETEEIDITDLVTAQQEIKDKQEEIMNNLFGKLDDLQSKLSNMDQILNKIDSLETKFDRYREKTPEEKLQLRSLDSYPYNQKLTDFFDDKKMDMEKTGKNEYVLTSDEVQNFSPNEIKKTFNNFNDEVNESYFRRKYLNEESNFTPNIKLGGQPMTVTCTSEGESVECRSTSNNNSIMVTVPYSDDLSLSIYVQGLKASIDPNDPNKRGDNDLGATVGDVDLSVNGNTIEVKNQQGGNLSSFDFKNNVIKFENIKGNIEGGGRFNLEIRMEPLQENFYRRRRLIREGSYDNSTQQQQVDTPKYATVTVTAGLAGQNKSQIMSKDLVVSMDRIDIELPDGQFASNDEITFDIMLKDLDVTDNGNLSSFGAEIDTDKIGQFTFTIPANKLVEKPGEIQNIFVQTGGNQFTINDGQLDIYIKHNATLGGEETSITERYIKKLIKKIINEESNWTGEIDLTELATKDRIRASAPNMDMTVNSVDVTNNNELNIYLDGGVFKENENIRVDIVIPGLKPFIENGGKSESNLGSSEIGSILTINFPILKAQFDGISYIQVFNYKANVEGGSMKVTIIITDSSVE